MTTRDNKQHAIESAKEMILTAREHQNYFLEIEVMRFLKTAYAIKESELNLGFELTKEPTKLIKEIDTLRTAESIVERTLNYDEAFSGTIDEAIKELKTMENN